MLFVVVREQPAVLVGCTSGNGTLNKSYQGTPLSKAECDVWNDGPSHIRLKLVVDGEVLCGWGEGWQAGLISEVRYDSMFHRWLKPIGQEARKED